MLGTSLGPRTVRLGIIPQPFYEIPRGSQPGLVTIRRDAQILRRMLRKKQILFKVLQTEWRQMLAI